MTRHGSAMHFVLTPFGGSESHLAGRVATSVSAVCSPVVEVLVHGGDPAAVEDGQEQVGHRRQDDEEGRVTDPVLHSIHVHLGRRACSAEHSQFRAEWRRETPVSTQRRL